MKQGHTFPVPVTVAEHLLGLASHDQLKVLLYILCHADEPLSPQRIAQSCKVPPDAVEEAVSFWQDANVLLASPEMPAARLTESAPQPAAPKPVMQTPEPPAPPPAVPDITLPPPKPAVSAELLQRQGSSRKFSLRPSEIAERVQKNPMIAEMFRTAEKAAGRMLNATEQESLIWMNEYLGLQPDIIMMLVMFCVQIECFQVRYIEKVALDWHDKGIMTHALVEADINRRIAARTFTGQMMKIFEMQKKPTTAQQEFFDAWCAAGYPIELIRLAYERCRDRNDDKVSFKYIDTTLVNWKKDGAKNAEDVKRLDAAFREKKMRQAAEQQNAPARKSAEKPKEDASFDLSDFDRLVNRF